LPPKKQFSVEVIIEAAFAITRRSGWPAVSARSIALELSSSTQPIYSYVASMGKLSNEVRIKAMLLLADYQTKSYTDNPYMNMAIGYIAFAREERNLFRFLHLDNARPLLPDEKMALDEAIARHLGKPLPMQTYFGKISIDKFNDIALKTWLFTHGLAVALCTGTMAAITDDEIRRLLEEVGGAVVTWQSSINGKSASKG
jgi:hypothetical protein